MSFTALKQILNSAALIAGVVFTAVYSPQIASAGTPQDAGFFEQPFVSPGGLVTSLAWAPDGSNRLFITLKDGGVRIAQNGVLLGPNFYTFAPYTGSECGVLSLVFDPNYISNKFVYIFYTVSSSVQRIVRLTDNNNVGQNLTTIIDNLPTVGANHDGGGMTIGADHNGNGNYLFWGVGNLGNGTGAGEGDDFTTLASKVGRANLNGTAPNDNPYYNAVDGIGPADFIWARGFRNPFTMNYQTTPKRLWVSVVGDSYEQIFQVNRGDYIGDRYNEDRQPQVTGSATSVPPKIKYRTNGSESFTVVAAPTGAQRSSGIATYTLSGNRYLKQGEKVTISGVADSSFNGTFYVRSVPAPNSFTVTQAGGNTTSGGGTVTTENYGGCVTGSSFYYGNTFPAAYRGNMFWGDCNSGNIMRAVFDGSNNVSQVNLFLASADSTIDTSVGPDGNLYYGTATGQVLRVVYVPPSQTILVSPTELNLVEGQTGAFSVRLSTAPASTVTVNVARVSGDTTATISQGSTLTFTPGNYSSQQPVQITAAEDSDSNNGSAVFNLTSSGLATQTVNVALNDNDPLSLVLSTNTLSVNEGGSSSFTVALSGQPGSDVNVTAARTAGDTNATVTAGANLTFTPTHYATPQTVTISAAEDANTTNSSATITISSAATPSRSIPLTLNDNDAAVPNITSTAILVGVQSSPYTYDVNATGAPVPTYSLTTAPSGMTINSTTGVISWTPGSTGNFSVTVQAANGVLPNATQSFVIAVSADQAPTCHITSPAPGGLVSGASADFFGDAFDDVGTVKAEFYIDNVLAYTDINGEEHYHINGGHARWDTTNLNNGTHLLRMTVFDTSGRSGFCEVSAIVSNAARPNPPSGLRIAP